MSGRGETGGVQQQVRQEGGRKATRDERDQRVNCRERRGHQAHQVAVGESEGSAGQSGGPRGPASGGQTGVEPGWLSGPEAG